MISHKMTKQKTCRIEWWPRNKLIANRIFSYPVLFKENLSHKLKLLVVAMLVDLKKQSILYRKRKWTTYNPLLLFLTYIHRSRLKGWLSIVYAPNSLDFKNVYKHTLKKPVNLVVLRKLKGNSCFKHEVRLANLHCFLSLLRSSLVGPSNSVRVQP